MASNMIDVPLRVLVTVTGISLTRWLDLINLKHACGDETIYTVLDQACKKLGLLPPVRTLERKIPFSFFVGDEQKLLVAKIKYNF